MTTNAIYDKPGTSITFIDSGGDITFTLNDTVDLGNGQVSNQWDRTAASLPSLYKWEAYIKWVATPTLGDVVRIYLYDSYVAAAAMDLAADGDVTPETKFGNFRFIGQVVCSIAADQTFYATGLVAIFGRYVNLGVWNASTSKDLNATAHASKIVLTPFHPDVQAAA
jgi:hypothetical protein